ncbi:MAG: cation-translocating P-type ATPase [Corallococcus sp.]|nr:cation-translocating P-type ATPase [Corallococcus sp.]MCM1358945.1 cation-translocating P-type ATPase [Corallococcus sp.]MCM1394933.1 cation-translocating P-type ATPase [Corallococcus sp.]
MEYYLQEKDEVLANADTSENGLSQQEAENRLKQNGANKLAEGKRTPGILKFLKQLCDPMILVLAVVAVVNLVTIIVNNADPANEKENFADVIIIAVVVLLNAVLGVVQESKAEKAVKALQTMTEATCKALRDGAVTVIKSTDLVVGDVILLEAGDSVPADCRVLQAASLKAEESALTGESIPTEKRSDALKNEAALADRNNMLYLGSTVVYGRGKAVVVATAMQTEMGKIADMLQSAKKEKTPLQIKMAHLSKVLTFVVVGICAVIFLLNLLLNGFDEPKVIMDSLLIAVGLAVASIPEGLATVVTIVLSIGVTNMSKKHAVIRKMTAVETLGCAEIICTDKTGTLTQNKMTVTETYGFDETLLATGMTLCCDANLVNGNAVGEPTECALVNFAYAKDLIKDRLEQASPRTYELPFDSERKMMSTFHQDKDGVTQYTKGAPDEILLRCSHVWQDGKARTMTDDDREKIVAANKNMANEALRVLALAFAKHENLPQNSDCETLENGLTFVGLCGMIDPVREEVAQSINRCKTAGIRPVMITGDHVDTAVAIAKQLGVITDASEAMTGAQLDALTDEQLQETVPQISVYARVKPEHKVRIVAAWKKLGKVCAMTGDGVNDAPSIKIADIGIGMGISGTDVTKNTADMVLADDNFATIVEAVSEGRRIYDNIRKCIGFLLSSNLAEVVAIFVATALGFTLLKPVHLLWINLITDTLPAVALGLEAADNDVMRRDPRKKKESVFSGGLGWNVLTHGIFLATLTLGAYLVGAYTEYGNLTLTSIQANSVQGTAMAFLTMSMAEILHAYNSRSEKSVFTLRTHNKVLWAAMLGSLALTTAVIFVPHVNAAFGFAYADGTACINAGEYFVALALAIAVVPLVELQKLLTRVIRPRKKKVPAKQ